MKLKLSMASYLLDRCPSISNGHTMYILTVYGYLLMEDIKGVLPIPLQVKMIFHSFAQSNSTRFRVKPSYKESKRGKYYKH